MPHKRAKKINGAANVKLVSSKLVPVLVDDLDANPSFASRVAADVCVSVSDASHVLDISLDTSTCFRASDYDLFVDLDVNPSNASCVADISLDTSACFRAPDFNPVFDLFDDLDAILCALSFKNAEKFSTTSDRLPWTSYVDAIPSNASCVAAQVGVAVSDASHYHARVLDDCNLVRRSLDLLIDFFAEFESAFYCEISSCVSCALLDEWSIGFCSSCLAEEQMFFEHFCFSSLPRVICFYGF